MEKDIEIMPRSLRLLLVEGSEKDASREILELRRSGFEPIKVRVDNEADMRDALAREDWDIIISEFALSNFDGLAALELRADLAPLTPFILVSGDVGDDIATEFMKAGADDYVMKSNLARLGQAVEKAMNAAVIKKEKLTIENKRRKAECLFQALYDHSHELIFLLDSEKRIIDLNQRALDILGVAPDEFEGVYFQEMMLDTSDVTHAVESLRNIPYTGWDMAIREYRLRHKDGRGVWVEATSSLVDLEDQTNCILVMARDITDRKRLEVDLAETDRLYNMGLLAAGVVHGINNALSYTLFNLETLDRALPKLFDTLTACKTRLEEKFGDDAIKASMGEATRIFSDVEIGDLRACVQESLRGASRIKDIIKGLATFTRVDEDSNDPVDLRHVIKLTTDLTSNEIRFRARLEVENGPVPPIVRGSDGRLSQVFLNMIINATHAIDEGNMEKNEIKIRTWVSDNQVYAEVSDTGCGIPPEHMGRLFVPFFTTKGDKKGSGLGLTISKRIIESHGGDISVRSEPGRGTCFTIRLPAANISATVPENHIPVGTNEDEFQGRILVVDDDRGNLNIITQILKHHQMILATDGAEAVRILRKDQKFDLIVCDVMMPNISGVDIHDWLRGTNSTLAKNFIFLSGGPFTSRIQQYLEGTENPLLKKPLDPAVLKAYVNKFLNPFPT